MSRNKNLVNIVDDDSAHTMWKDVLDSYLLYLHGCGRSQNTVDIYRDQISRFYKKKAPLWDDEKNDFLAWNGESQIHTNHRLDSCNRFWQWAVRENYRKTNPAETVQRRSMNKSPVANVNLTDIEKLVKKFRTEYKERPHQWEKVRNYAYILFAIGTGVRPGEGLKLRRSDFNMEEMYVIVRGEHAKTSQSRVIYIPQNKTLSTLLKRMIKAHEKAGFHKDLPLLSDSAGKGISSRSWFHIVKKRANELGIAIKPYDFRHAFITHSLIEGANPYDLRDQVGHSNMNMMKRYYHSNPDARRATANLAPLQKLSSV